MSDIEFIIIYLLAAGIGYGIGHIVGRHRAETEATRLRRWWRDREQRNRGDRFRG